MSTMMRLGAVALGAGLTIALAGCSAPPSQAAVAERFRIELEAASDYPYGFLDDPEVVASINELSEEVADNLLDGGCAIDPASGFEAADLEDAQAYIYAVNQTCLMYFEDEMSEAQVERAKQLLLDKVTEDLSE